MRQYKGGGKYLNSGGALHLTLPQKMVGHNKEIRK